MKPTQQRTEEGELPALEVWQDDYGRLSAEMKSPYFRDFGPGRHEYVPASQVERAKEALRKIAWMPSRGNTHDDSQDLTEAMGIARAALRDLGEGQ